MPPDPSTAELRQQQQALRRKMIAIARWLKHRYDYSGSKETSDLVGRGFEKLVGSEHYAHKVRSSPGELLDLSGRLMRQVLCDELRARSARRRRAIRVALDEERVGSDPSVERRIDEARRYALVERLLGQIERGETPFRFPKGGPMAAAFRLRCQGLSEQAVAARLGVAKGTAHNWIRHVTAYLARRVAETELQVERE